jgi:two-component system response regulator AtoC
VTPPVLIYGESGTGKELIALNIWARGPRKKSMFWPINCGNIPRDLIGSELFGHEKGAFTGAVERRVGAFEIAHGGVLFLDEIGELAYEHQSNLLRVLEEGSFCRIGGRVRTKADVRVISATNKNLEAAMKRGEFRKDLFYRLNVVCIEVPPLRERREDIPVLSQHFLQEAERREGKKIAELDPAFVDWLISQEWPGNIRELQNVIRRAVLLAPPGVSILTLPEPTNGRQNPDIFSLDLGLGESVERLERMKITRALAQTGGNVSKAAKLLKIQRNKLIRTMEKLKILS